MILKLAQNLPLYVGAQSDCVIRHKGNGILSIFLTCILLSIVAPPLMSWIQSLHMLGNEAPITLHSHLTLSNSVMSKGYESIELKSQADGGYYISGSINKFQMLFQVDTGASLTSIPKEIADKAGIYSCTESTFETSNGPVTGCVATIPELKFGNFSIYAIDVAVMPNLKNPLLGMNVLRHIRLDQSDGVLRLYSNTGNKNAKTEVLRKAADQGSAITQYTLGKLYDEGNGVSQDDSQAFLWYSKAADQGVDKAQNNLRVMYANGQGVPKDYIQAIKWFHIAKARGVVVAGRNSQFAEAMVTPAQIAEGERMEREWLSEHQSETDYVPQGKP